MLPTHRPPTHPGEMLLKEFLEPLGVSQVEAADRMNIPFQRLNAIVKGRRAVSADTALLLEALTRLGRADLADAAGQVGPVARAEGPRQQAEGPPTAQDRIVTAAAHATRISQCSHAWLTPCPPSFPNNFEDLSSGGNEYFFHQSAIYGEGINDLREGDSVEFEIRQGPKGPRAENVRRTST